MNQCPRCGKFALTERSDILPRPPGTDWAPLPRKWVECANCGYDSRLDHGAGSPTSDLTNTLSPAMIALLAVLIALTTVFTLLVRVPTPARGYVNLSDVAITFASLVFGPWVGLVAGGVGTALADLLGGFAAFAPLSLVAHGLEGLLIGLLARGGRAVPVMVVAWLAGALAMVAVYLVGEGLFYTGWPPALAEAPMNLFQALIGGVIGIPLVLAIRKAYPPIERLGRRQTWTEE